MQVTPHLPFPGNCEEALQFYEKALGAKTLRILTYAETPMASHVPPDWGKKIVHGRFQVGDTFVMVVDAGPDHYQAPKGISLTLSIDEPQEAERVFNALAEGGSIGMPIQETFWAHRFGVVTDRFAIPWMVNCEKRE